MAYITIDELQRLGCNPSAFDDLSDADLTMAIAAASSEADTYLTAAYDKTPLEQVPLALKLHVARATVYHLMTMRGFSPDGDDRLILENYDRALAFYKALQKSQQNLPNTETTPKRGESVVVSSAIRRGW